jgi:hypothetical protein
MFQKVPSYYYTTVKSIILANTGKPSNNTLYSSTFIKFIEFVKNNYTLTKRTTRKLYHFHASIHRFTPDLGYNTELEGKLKTDLCSTFKFWLQNEKKIGIENYCRCIDN